MTVISEPIADIAGADNNTNFRFSVPILRENDTGTGMVTTRVYQVQARNGILTTPDLDAGPATVEIGLKKHPIVIPDSPTPIRLWPLVQAGMPVPPTEEAAAVRNGGGITRAQALSLAAYQAIPTPDPETLYFTP